MTKKHYVAIARAISDLRGNGGDGATLDSLTAILGGIMAGDNERFDAVRFYSAAGFHADPARF